MIKKKARRGTVQLSVQVDPSLKAEFYGLCEKLEPEQTASQVIRSLVRNWMAEQTTGTETCSNG